MTDFNNLTALKAEQDLRIAQRPKEPTGYQPVLPQDFKLPEGVDKFEIDAADPNLKEAREFAFENNFSQEKFSKLMGIYAKATTASETQIAEAKKAEIAKLGENGTARIDAITTWLKAKGAGGLADVLFTADIVGAMEKLMQAGAGSSANFNSAHNNAEVTKDQWSKMTRPQQLAYSRELEKKQEQARAAR
jgi:hypothetical protein